MRALAHFSFIAIVTFFFAFLFVPRTHAADELARPPNTSGPGEELTVTAGGTGNNPHPYAQTFTPQSTGMLLYSLVADNCTGFPDIQTRGDSVTIFDASSPASSNAGNVIATSTSWVNRNGSTIEAHYPRGIILTAGHTYTYIYNGNGDSGFGVCPGVWGSVSPTSSQWNGYFTTDGSTWQERGRNWLLSIFWGNLISDPTRADYPVTSATNIYQLDQNLSDSVGANNLSEYGNFLTYSNTTGSVFGYALHLDENQGVSFGSTQQSYASTTSPFTNTKWIHFWATIPNTSLQSVILSGGPGGATGLAYNRTGSGISIFDGTTNIPTGVVVPQGYTTMLDLQRETTTSINIYMNGAYQATISGINFPLLDTIGLQDPSHAPNALNPNHFYIDNLAFMNATSTQADLDALWNGGVGRRLVVGTTTPKEPVIIVPGILGSKLNRVSNGQEIWPNTSQMASLLHPSDSYLDDLGLSTTGQQISGKEMSSTDIIRSESVAIFSKTFYKNLIDSFVSSGYIEGQNLFVDPYDWRSDIGSSMNALGSKILQAISISPTGKVNIIAHSMGGLLLKKYLSTLQNTSFIDKLVFVGVPQLGAPKALKVLNYGDNFDISILNPNEIKKISQNMPSVYQLLPSRRYVQLNGSYVQDFRNGGSQLLDYDQTSAFIQSTNASSNPSLLGNADTFHNGFDTQAVNASSVYNILACQNSETFGQFRIYDGNKVEVTAVDGDGTVPSLSAENVGSSFARQYFVLNSRKDHNDHLGLVRDTAGLALIQNVINSQPDVLPQEISTSSAPCFTALPNPTTIIWSTHSPVDLHVYDSQNRHTGPTANGDPELGIPFSDYQKIGDNSFVFVPASDTYKIVSQGLSSGSFDLEARIYNGTALTNTVTYLSVPLQSASTTAILNFSGLQGNMSLGVDVNGDGIVDNTIQPNAILYAASSSDVTPPTITLPTIPSEVLVGTPLTFTFSAIDDVSGVAVLNATLDGAAITNGLTTSTLQLGNHTFVVKAVDNAGNPRVASLTFRVTYGFGGFLPPVKADGSGIYQQGRTLPMKFQLTNASGTFVSTAVAHLFLSKISDGIAGTEEVALSTSAADTGNQFRYDSTANQYMFNLSLAIDIGTWRLRVELDDGKSYAVDVSVKQ